VIAALAPDDTLALPLPPCVMKKESFMLKPPQCRAARALLNWTQAELADRTAISAVSIRAFEKGGEMRESNLRLIKLTFETAGVVFQDEGELISGGLGVRFRSSSAADDSRG